MCKATNLHLDKAYLDERTARLEANGYSKPKWIIFCETVMEKGLDVSLYEARKTFSKYITVKKGEDTFKVRFSNHKPIFSREIKRDCDFFVGITNLKTTTTEQAIIATLKHFKIKAEV